MGSDEIRKKTEEFLDKVIDKRKINFITGNKSNTPLSDNEKIIVDIYYRSVGIRIAVNEGSSEYDISMRLENEGIAYQKDSVNPRSKKGKYQFFV